jgi:6-pyruvoyltetrahydropterin/6-carboxytetrahydropterin synthase
MAATTHCTMKVAKRFHWEGAHRLPWHKGLCRNLHGHSYGLTIQLEGTPDERGMLVDFQDLKTAIKPLIDAWDHATLIAQNDEELIRVLGQTDWKRAILPFDTTAENIAAYTVRYLAEHHGDSFRAQGVRRITARLDETTSCYAEAEFALDLTDENAPS